jgi:flagellar biosynthesis chaperone FliJ
MTLQDFEHRLENVEAQHATYVTVLSNHTSTLSGLVSQVMTLQQQVLTLQQSMTHVIAELATLRQGQERLEAFLRQKLNGKGGE